MPRQFKRTPYWVFFLLGPIITFLTMLAVRGSVSRDSWSLWAVSAFPTAAVFAIAEAIRRHREEE